ncbi:cofactor assembly of complex C subunit B [Oscillatoria salina]|uniref:cofactor assembly of complex C subunit B n=1 Tax=Oscillatoria salina TaxID=331517 RepID=UPI0013BAC1D3|nr:cofactor assembly of complex C subunit B [Oscillatoria salina]MBZ8181356.1 cofactor assembly of complex C subunit B [Oscillatoria salina IIICB1]NET89747.1 cofactor assembly of complex C subunit B [Kamptonema sp. SIO1D9]
MDTPILTSTFFLTLLLMVGLFFFIRASAKDRTTQVQLIASESEASVLDKLQQYFTQRAYRVAAVDEEQHQLIFTGFVQPSWFLAIFLSFLAACGFLCLGLVLSFLFPQIGNWFLGLILLAPIAGIYYWQKAGRTEEVSLQIQQRSPDNSLPQSLLTVTAHRDELIQLQQALPFQPAPSELSS